jgi:hypothetical protein
MGIVFGFSVQAGALVAGRILPVAGLKWNMISRRAGVFA